MSFYTILTNKGITAEAYATANDEKVAFHTMVFGSGDNNAAYDPTADQTALKNQVDSVEVSSATVNPDNENQLIIIARIPPENGGYFIREVGVKDEDGDLLVVGSFPEHEKTVLAEGSTEDLVIQIIIEVGNTDNFTVTIDASVVGATQEWVLGLKSPFLFEYIESTSNMQYEQLRQAEKLKTITGSYI